MKKENALFIGYHILMISIMVLSLLSLPFDLYNVLAILLLFSAPISEICIIAGSMISLRVMKKYDLDLKKCNKAYIFSIIISVIAGYIFYTEWYFSPLLSLIPIAVLFMYIIHSVTDNKERIVFILSSPIVYFALILISIRILDYSLGF